MNKLILTFIGLALAAPSIAFAQNGSTPGTLQLYPTFESIGARMTYTGDANSNATARIEWRIQGAPTWTQGVSMTRITGSRWAGSVLWLSPGTNYEVRAVITDADGGGTSSAVSAATRSVPPATPSGRVYWVATNGSDSNDGSSGAPLATLNGAGAKASPGDEIRLRPGIYYQTFDTPKAGTASAPIHIVADGPGVIIDGSDPALLNTTWRSDGGGVYSVAYTPTANRLVYADTSQRLYKHGSLSDLQSNANGISQGFAVSGGRLHVKLEDGSNPSNHTMHVARYNVGLYIDSPYWHVKGLEIRFFGNAANGAGIQFYGSGSSCWIENNHIRGHGGRGVFLRSGASDNLIERNIVRDSRIGTWPWAATKAHDEESAGGISNRGGRGNVIRHNTIRGTFDGIDASGGAEDENAAADCDISNNTIMGTTDDGLEPEDCSGINMRITRNHVDRTFSGMSISPNFQGPTYVLYNLFTNTFRGGFKFSISATGQTWLCHNTVISDVSGSPAVHPSGPYSNRHFRNNILVGNGSAAVSDDAGESASGNTFDGDLIYSNYAALFRWKGTNYSTIAALRSGTGFEASGRSGNPLFVSQAGGDFRLQAGSPAIDGAIRLPGINDTYSGTAPDMGALEYGSITIDTTPPATINDLR